MRVTPPSDLLARSASRSRFTANSHFPDWPHACIAEQQLTNSSTLSLKQGDTSFDGRLVLSLLQCLRSVFSLEVPSCKYDGLQPNNAKTHSQREAFSHAAIVMFKPIPFSSTENHNCNSEVPQCSGLFGFCAGLLDGGVAGWQTAQLAAPG